MLSCNVFRDGRIHNLLAVRVLGHKATNTHDVHQIVRTNRNLLHLYNIARGRQGVQYSKSLPTRLARTLSQISQRILPQIVFEAICIHHFHMPSCCPLPRY